jgi:hypothetical protein
MAPAGSLLAAQRTERPSRPTGISDRFTRPATPDATVCMPQNRRP